MDGGFWLFAVAERIGVIKGEHLQFALVQAAIAAMTETTSTITLAQLNPTVGDVAGNAAKARVARDKAKADGADLLVLPELFITGYPPEDLVLKPAFQAACRSAIEELAR